MASASSCSSCWRLLAGLALDNARIYTAAGATGRATAGDARRAARRAGTAHSQRAAGDGRRRRRARQPRDPQSADHHRRLRAHTDGASRRHRARRAQRHHHRRRSGEARGAAQGDARLHQPEAAGPRTDGREPHRHRPRQRASRRARRPQGHASSWISRPICRGVLADRNQLQRVFLNLWQNALQAMDETPAERTRVLARAHLARRQHGEGRVLGYRPRHSARPCCRTSSRRSSRPSSAAPGLGLAVVKKIIDDHHGSIEVQPRAGTGHLVGRSHCPSNGDGHATHPDRRRRRQPAAPLP